MCGSGWAIRSTSLTLLDSTTANTLPTTLGMCGPFCWSRFLVTRPNKMKHCFCCHPATLRNFRRIWHLAAFLEGTQLSGVGIRLQPLQTFQKPLKPSVEASDSDWSFQQLVWANGVDLSALQVSCLLLGMRSMMVFNTRQVRSCGEEGSTSRLSLRSKKCVGCFGCRCAGLGGAPTDFIASLYVQLVPSSFWDSPQF